MEKFKNIFEGLKIAYGQYQKGDRSDIGSKQKGKAFIVRKDVTDDLWEKHLQGEGAALGIVPITETNDCKWGCIDIDQYNFDHLSLVKEVFFSGPPCLNKLASTGFGEGSRNNALFNIAVYYKQANPDTWEDEIVKANMKYMNPPLSNNEVQQLIKSVSRKGYDKYRCKDAPINSVCQSGLCRTKKFGVGFGEEQMPILGNLTKYTSNPPQWFLNVGEKRIELKTEQLYSPALFAIACLDQANLVIPIPKPKDWKQYYLKPLLNNGLEEVEPLESLDPINQLTGLLQDWTTNRQSARTMEDIFNKLPYTDDNKEFTYFRMDDFYAFLKKNNWETDKIKTGNLLKRLQNVFVEEIRKNIKKQYSRLIKIKTMKKIEPSVSNITYNEEHF
jgi:hypothetical protein